MLLFWRLLAPDHFYVGALLPRMPSPPPCVLADVTLTIPGLRLWRFAGDVRQGSLAQRPRPPCLVESLAAIAATIDITQSSTRADEY